MNNKKLICMLFIPIEAPGPWTEPDCLIGLEYECCKKCARRMKDKKEEKE